jgi:hypothetical protein
MLGMTVVHRPHYAVYPVIIISKKTKFMHTGVFLSSSQSKRKPQSSKMTPESTGRFIMYSRITKIYYTKAIGHVFTKPVQIEETTEKFFSQ